MSASPPPPPPPQAPPPPVTGPQISWDGRTMRDQRKAAALAARQQRTMARQQARALRRHSILGPLLLVALGVLFLLIEMRSLRPEAVLYWLARWWPALLLGAGLILVAEWAADSWIAGQRQQALPRRTLGAGGVLFLTFIAIAGLASAGMRNGSDWLRHNLDGEAMETWGLDQLFAQKTETDQELVAPLAKGALLSINNYRGDINLSGSSTDGQVHISVHQRLLSWRGDDLASRQHGETPRLEKSATGLLLTVPGQDRDRAVLTIEVPHESGVELLPTKGDVSLSEIRGPVTVHEHQGSINLTALTGEVQLTVRDDDATVAGHSLSGNLTLTGRSGDLSFSDISGPLTLRGDFFGTTHLERVAGPVHFQSSFTTFSCAQLPGSLDIEGRSQLQARSLAGPVLLTTTDRNLTLEDVRGAATINDRNGSITLGLTGPLSTVTANTTDGSIDLHVPEQAGFQLKATTADGRINNDFGLSPQVQDNRASLTEAIRKGGPAVVLQTTEGDISVRKGSAASAKSEHASDSTVDESSTKEDDD